ncbi:MAG: MFS transporter [Chloroflexi bacterium]|nr:MFS transporter [Chloroflexota bacterium]
MTNTGSPRFFYGYVIVAAAFIIHAMTMGTFQSYGVFFVPLLNDFGWSRALISGASSLSYFLMGLIGILSGSINDKTGPRVIFITTALFLGAGYMLTSQVNSVWQLYLFFGLMVGIGGSAADVVLLSTIARWFVKKRGLMSGLSKVGTGLGIMVMPLLARQFISIYDWRVAFVILGIISTVVIIAMAQFLRRDPYKMRLQPDGIEQTTVQKARPQEVGTSFREAARTRQFWIVFFAFMAFGFCTQSVLVHIAPHAQGLGISAANAAVVLAIIGGSSMVGRLAMGYVSDRIGNKRTLTICFVILISTLVSLQFFNDLGTLYLFGAIYGFGHGGFFGVYSPLVALLFGTRSQGSIFGTAVFAVTFGGAIGPIVTGYTFDLTDSYRLGFLILVAASSAGLVLLSLLRPLGAGKSKPAR